MSTTRVFLLALCLSVALYSCSAAEVSAALSGSDVDHVVRLVSRAQKNDGSFASAKDAHFMVASLLRLGKAVPKKDSVCKYLKSQVSDESTAENVFRVVATANALGCGSALSDTVKDNLVGLLSDEAETIESWYFAASALLTARKSGHVTVSDEDITQVVSRVVDLMENNGAFTESTESSESSPVFTGFAYHTLALIKAECSEMDESDAELLSSVTDTVEEYFSEADGEKTSSFVDVKIGNLKPTALILSGVLALTKAMEIDSDLSAEQISKFSEFFVVNRLAGSLEDAFYTTMGLEVCSSNDVSVPLVLSVLPRSNSSGNNLRVSVTNVMGKFATAAKVFLVRAHHNNHAEKAIFSNQEVFAVDDSEGNTAYQFNFFDLKLEPGFYALEFRVTPADEESAFTPLESVARTVKVSSDAQITKAEITLADTEDIESAVEVRRFKAKHPKMVDDVVKAHSTQYLRVSFAVKSTTANKFLTPHQAFVRFTSEATGHEAIFVAPHTDKTYEFTLGIGRSGKSSFKNQSGAYKMELVVGDAFMQRSIVWKVAKVELNFGADAEEVTKKAGRPDIAHTFRVPESRPVSALSSAFTLAAMAPIGLFVALLFLVNANISNFPFSGTSFIYAVGFQACIAAMFFVYFLFWLKFNIFTTMYYMCPISFGLVVFGRRALRDVAVRSVKKDD